MMRCVSGFSIVTLLLVVAVSSSMAQELAGIPIQFAGRIAAIDGTTLTVNQLRIEISEAEVSTALQVDSHIVIRGILLDNGVVTAQTITIYVPPIATPAAIPATLDPAILSILEQSPASVVIEGAVQRIEDGRLWVNGMPFDYDPDDPVLEDLQVGDVLRIEGSAAQIGDTPVITATDIRVIERASDEDDEEENDQQQGMGMGMGMGD